MLSTSLPSYLWGNVILTAAHLINRLPSRILHLQTPLECLKESYPSTRLVSEVTFCVFRCTPYVHSFGPNQTKFTHQARLLCLLGIPFTSVVINIFTRRPGNTLSLWMLLSVRTDPIFPLTIFKGRV
ncbi:hypothetical protein IC582_010610 [Cucumis melo]